MKEERNEIVNTYLPHFDPLNKWLWNLLKSINPHKIKEKTKVLYYWVEKGRLVFQDYVLALLQYFMQNKPQFFSGPHPYLAELIKPGSTLLIILKDYSIS